MREAISNALTHRDYTSSELVRVAMRSDSIEVTTGRPVCRPYPRNRPRRENPAAKSAAELTQGSWIMSTLRITSLCIWKPVEV